MRPSVLWLCATLITPVVLLGQERPIDTQRSKITIHTGKSGLLSAAAHNHTINAPIASGTMRESAPQRIEFTVQAAKLMVEPNPKINAKDQATIQADMENMTLEVNKFREIVFRSSHIDKLPSGEWKVDGDLTLHRRNKACEPGGQANWRFLYNTHGAQANRFRHQAHQYR